MEVGAHELATLGQLSHAPFAASSSTRVMRSISENHLSPLEPVAPGGFGVDGMCEVS